MLKQWPVHPIMLTKVSDISFMRGLANIFLDVCHLNTSKLHYFKILHRTPGEIVFLLGKKHRLRIIQRVGCRSDDWRQTCGRELVWHAHIKPPLYTSWLCQNPLVVLCRQDSQWQRWRKWAKISQAPLERFQSKDILACSPLRQLSPVFRSNVVMLRFSLYPVILNDWVQERTTLENVLTGPFVRVCMSSNVYDGVTYKWSINILIIA